MSGTIEVAEGARWSAQGWFFDVALRALGAAPISDGLKADIQEVMDDNLGWFSFDDASEVDRAALRETLNDGSFLAHVDAGLPMDLPDRQGALAHAGALVHLATQAAHE